MITSDLRSGIQIRNRRIQPVCILFLDAFMKRLRLFAF